MKEHEQQTSRLEKISDFFGESNFLKLNNYQQTMSLRTVIILILLGTSFSLRAENLLPNDGFFGRTVPNAWRPKTGGIVTAPVWQGHAVWKLAPEKKQRLSTPIFPLPEKGMLVLEVTARAENVKTPLDVIVVANGYKNIRHMKFRSVGPEWKTYRAVLEVPNPAVKKEFLGLIDVFPGTTVFLGQTKLYWLESNERIAGDAAGDNETAVKSMNLAANLTGAPLPPPVPGKPVTAQLNNKHQFRSAVKRNSVDIKDNALFGAATDLYLFSEHRKGTVSPNRWSPEWIIADRTKKYGVNEYYRNYSSRSVKLAKEKKNLNEFVLVSWKNPQRLTKIQLVPRFSKVPFPNFPRNFKLEISSDGKNWKTIAAPRDFIGGLEQLVFSFPEQPVREIRFTALDLNPETPNSKIAYLQLKSLLAMDGQGKNLALPRNGAKVRCASSLYMDKIDYDKFRNLILSNGIRHLLLMPSRRIEYNDNLRANLTDIKANGITIAIRFNFLPLARFNAEEWKAYREKYIADTLKKLRMLKGLITTVAIGNEENMYRFGRQNITGKLTRQEYIQRYVELVREAALAIKKEYPQMKIEIETALFDFDWTSAVLKGGLAGIVNVMGVHIYREHKTEELRPESVRSFFLDGRRGYPHEKKIERGDDEIIAYRKLLDSIDPALEFHVTETAANRNDSPAGMCTTDLGQAKFLARLYISHLFHKLGPTNWWTLQCLHSGHSKWGLLDSDAGSTAALDTMGYLASILDYGWKPAPEIHVDNPDVQQYAFRKKGDALVAVWIPVSMRDLNTGKVTDLTITGIPQGGKIESLDTLTGTWQQLDGTWKDGKLILPQIVLRDYPLLIHVKLELDEKNASSQKSAFL